MRLPIVIQTMLLLMISLVPSAQAAGTPEEKGLAIAVEADARDTGWGDNTAHMLMTLKNKHGQTSERKIRIKTLEVKGDGDKSLSIFDNPRDVKGTAFLSYSHQRDDDDQWLYLPALKRVKRISSSNKSGSFMGSEFAYEDIASQEVAKYTYKWIKDDTLDGQESFVIERYPVDQKNSGYTRQIVWIDKLEYRMLKIEFYDRKNSLLKTLIAKGYKQYLNRFWRAGEMAMVNHQNGKSTSLVWNGYQFGLGLTEATFNKTGLKRAK